MLSAQKRKSRHCGPTIFLSATGNSRPLLFVFGNRLDIAIIVSMNIRRTIANGLIFIVIVLGLGCAGEARKVQQQGSLAGQPKNVIILISDGCGYNHIKATDYYQCGQVPCQTYEKFPVRLAMSTYEARGLYDGNTAWTDFDYVKKQTTDSAASATAMAAGVKTLNGRIGLDVKGKKVLNLVERAEQLGKATGVITSVPFSHATPAGFVAHNISRNNYRQIAEEMVNQSALDVIMGTGHPFYDDDGKIQNTPHYKYVGLDVWKKLKAGSAGGDADGDGTADHWTLVQTRDQFESLAAGPTPKRLLGVPQAFESLQEKRSGNADAPPYKVPLTQTLPTLEQMSRAALNVLDEDPDGFFLMIEGGAVDWAGHDNHSGRLIEEMIDFNKSVDAVIDWVERHSNWDQTLVIVTADHETGYITGPDSGKGPTGAAWNELINKGAGNLPEMQWNSSGHTNSLVPFFAKGAGAQLFEETLDGRDTVRGPYIDNTDIANVIFSLWAGN